MTECGRPQVLVRLVILTILQTALDLQELSLHLLQLLDLCLEHDLLVLCVSELLLFQVNLLRLSVQVLVRSLQTQFLVAVIRLRRHSLVLVRVYQKIGFDALRSDCLFRFLFLFRLRRLQ